MQIVKQNRGRGEEAARGEEATQQRGHAPAQDEGKDDG
jgi:hypothetical protein